ncbi:MAG: carboxymuconolactone decarboxylase family protein [Simkania sp.]|nr:carboxymuconolactone decarboxylase family protein [Simkania sp.]
MSEKYEQGLKLLKKLHGGHAGEEILNAIGDVGPDMARMIIEWGFGEVMIRPQLDLKTRELAIIASLISLGYCMPQLTAHVEAALSVGAKKEEIVELIMQTAIYSGFPGAVNALIHIKHLLK